MTTDYFLVMNDFALHSNNLSIPGNRFENAASPPDGVSPVWLSWVEASRTQSLLSWGLKTLQQEDAASVWLIDHIQANDRSGSLTLN